MLCYLVLKPGDFGIGVQLFTCTARASEASLTRLEKAERGTSAPKRLSSRTRRGAVAPWRQDHKHFTPVRLNIRTVSDEKTPGWLMEFRKPSRHWAHIIPVAGEYLI